MSEKRRLPAEGSSNKRAKNIDSNDNTSPDLVEPLGSIPLMIPEGLDALSQPNLPPPVDLPPDVNFLDNEEGERFAGETIALNESEVKEISKLKKLLKSAYADASTATHNPNIYIRVAPVSWHLRRFDGGKKSLPAILHVEEGWTADWLIEEIAKSSDFSDIRIYPLNRPESRVLCAALRYRYRINEMKATSTFEIDVPESWMKLPLKYKTFFKKSAKTYAMKLAGTVAYNQAKFVGQEAHAFRKICKDLEWTISETFAIRFLVAIFVVCVDVELLHSSTDHIEGTWGENRSAVKTAFVNAVKNAEEVKYPETLALFKELFPWVLA